MTDLLFHAKLLFKTTVQTNEIKNNYTLYIYFLNFMLIINFQYIVAD